MQLSKPPQRNRRLGRIALVLGIALLGATGSSAVTIPGGVYTLPVGAGDATTVDLGVAAPFPGTPQWVRLRPNDPPDPLQDYTAIVSGSFVSGPTTGTPSNPQIFNITFSVAWNGTINEQAPTQAVASQMLFAIVDSRFGPGMSFDTTSDLPQSGFVRGSFAVNGTPVATPEIIRDDTGPMSGNYPEGFVSDFPDLGCPCNRWIGFYLPATPGVTQSITMQWALGQGAPSTGNVFFPNALFLPVPEPGSLTLAVAVLLGFAGFRRARSL
ncbi:MAG: hypothetical protein JRH01_16025 [Deltaproteobacteria bacterium]|nr:hypothetical protein [Deltaproteobacteria bacterium]MBW2393296.1 hypothetical protein [Deltaproteobacteria bacterium]